MSLVDSALKSAQKLTDSMGNGGIAAVHASNKLFGDGFELTCLGWAIRGVDPVNLCSWEEVNHVGDNKPNELGFVSDFSYKYKIHAIHYYGYPSKLQDIKFFVDDLGPLKTKLREYKREDMKEKHLEDIQILKHMKNESMISPIGFKNRVIEILSNFDQFKSKIWRQGGRVITVLFRTAQYDGAEELGKLMTRALNGKIPGYKAVLVGVDHVGSEWFADIKFKKEDDKMTIEEAKDILSKSGKKTINESYLERENVENLYAFALEALFFADQIHLWHWTCKSGFHHTHLQEVYESLRDFADELVEICLASGKKFAVKANTRELGGDGDLDVQDAIDELEEFVDQIQAFAKDFEDETEITTLLDDEAKALTKEIGLLKSFS